jgi:hypothetical protein
MTQGELEVKGRPMAWTTETPTQSGYYFWRSGPDDSAVAVWVSKCGTALRVGTLRLMPTA